jgi:hypothetical protein
MISHIFIKMESILKNFVKNSIDLTVFIFFLKFFQNCLTFNDSNKFKYLFSSLVLS